MATDEKTIPDLARTVRVEARSAPANMRASARPWHVYVGGVMLRSRHGVGRRFKTKEAAQLAGSVASLQAAVRFAETVAPLPRCRHGNALRDGGGDTLDPSCGCRL